jgi:hypothetical protein
MGVPDKIFIIDHETTTTPQALAFTMVGGLHNYNDEGGELTCSSPPSLSRGLIRYQVERPISVFIHPR